MYESVIRYRCTSMLEAGYLKSGKILKFRNRASSSVRLLNRTQFSIERLGVVASADLCTPGLASARIADAISGTCAKGSPRTPRCAENRTLVIKAGYVLQ